MGEMVADADPRVIPKPWGVVELVRAVRGLLGVVASV